MGVVYRYTDLEDNQIKYVGIVWSGNRSLKQRVEEHKERDEWCKNRKWIIEYLKRDVECRTDAEYLEAHYTNKFRVDGNEWFGKTKLNWGESNIIDDSKDEWIIYYTDEEEVSNNTCDIEVVEKAIGYNYKYGQTYTFFDKYGYKYCITEICKNNDSLIFISDFFGTLINDLIMNDLSIKEDFINNDIYYEGIDSRTLFNNFFQKNKDDFITVTYSEIDETIENVNYYYDFVPIEKNDEYCLLTLLLDEKTIEYISNWNISLYKILDK